MCTSLYWWRFSFFPFLFLLFFEPTFPWKLNSGLDRRSTWRWAVNCLEFWSFGIPNNTSVTSGREIDFSEGQKNHYNDFIRYICTNSMDFDMKIWINRAKISLCHSDSFEIVRHQLLVRIGLVALKISLIQGICNALKKYTWNFEVRSCFWLGRYIFIRYVLKHPGER